MTQSNSTEVTVSTKTILVSFTVFFTIITLFAIFLPHLLGSLLFAFVLSYLLNPLVHWLEKKKIKRSMGAVVALAASLILIGLLLTLFIPPLIRQTEGFISRLPQYYEKLKNFIYPLLSHYFPEYAEENGFVFSNLEQFLTNFTSEWKTVASPMGGVLKNVLSTTIRIISNLLGLLVIPLLSFYLLKDFHEIPKKMIARFPRKIRPAAKEIQHKLDMVLGGFLRGQLIVSSCLGLYYAAAFSLLGLDLGLFLGLLTGLMNLIPLVGILVSLVLSFLSLALHQGTSMQYLGLVLIYGLGAALESGFLTPRVLGEKVGLSPLLLILALLAGGELFGFLGMLLAVPVAAVLKVFLDYALNHLDTGR